jgi:predicted MFS family arabinose efflux permease
VTRDLKILLAADFLLRIVGISCYTLFIAAIYNMTGDASDIGFIGAATVLPALGVALLSTKYVARFSALNTVGYLMAARALIFAAAAVIPMGTVLILVTAALHSLVNQAAISAKMSLDAEILDDENRRKYNSRKTMLANIAIIAGPPLGGVLVEGVGFTTSLLVMGALSAGVAALLKTLRQPNAAARPREKDVSTSPFASLRYLRSIPLVASIVGLYCLVAVILEVEAPLMFPFVREIYLQGSGFTGLLLGLAGIGGVSGAFLAQKFPATFREAAIPYLIVLDGIIFILFALIRQILLACGLFTLLGVMGAVTLVVVEGTVQQNVVKLHRPFVFSVMQFASGAGGASLGIVTAFLAHAFGAKPVLAACAATEIVAGAACLLSIRLRLDERSSV